MTRTTGTNSTGRWTQQRTVVALAILGVLLLAVIAGGVALSTYVVSDPSNVSNSTSSIPRAAEMGAVAPEISLQRLENGSAGSDVTLSALRGHPVILNFWATWCQPCRDEFPVLDAVYRKYRQTDDLEVIAVNIQDGSTPAQVQTFIGEMGVVFPIWLTGADDFSVEKDFKVQAMPTTFFIDREGIIRQIRIGGPLTQEYLEQQLDKIK